MYRTVLFVALATPLVLAATTWAQAAEPEPISIDLAYRGLDGAPGHLRYGFAMGYGRPGNVKDTPFVEAVRRHAKDDVEIVYNRGFEDRMLSAVETADGEAKRFYFDINADGKLTDNEIFEPTNKQKGSNYSNFEFVTSDFYQSDDQGGKTPFRVRMTANFFSGQEQPSCMWSPACVLEGTGQVNDKDLKLLLFVGGLTPDFFQYGRARYAFTAPDKEAEYVPQSTLSSLIFYEGTFYKLKFEGELSESDGARAILVRDTSPTGTLAVELKGEKELNTSVSYATVNGKSDPTVHFQIRGSQEFPIGRYVLESGQFQYGQGELQNWQVGFSDGPDFSIEDGKTTTLKLSDPELTIRSVDENKRYNPDVQDLNRFSTNNRIYLSPVVSGVKGETYMRFQKRQGVLGALAGRYSDVKPHLVIKGPSGDTLVDQDLEYG